MSREGDAKRENLPVPMKSLVIREATEADIPALARLHVATWNATYPRVAAPPTYGIREGQWREAFALHDGSWFCFVVEHGGQLVGFAKGKRYHSDDLPDFSGELNKIYLLREYQGRGLGRRLVGEVAQRFLNESISSMVLFSDPENPSCRFYEALGGEKIFARNGEFHGTYGWHDLRKLVAQAAPLQD
jgi:ribosomal protein S18 acetylase RimI-like enzyme